MRTTAILGFVLVALTALCRPAPPRPAVKPAPSATPRAAGPVVVSVVATAASSGDRPNDEIDRVVDCRSVPELIARLAEDPPEAVAIAAIIALGRCGDPAALSALRAEVNPAHPFRAAQAIEAICAIGEAAIASQLADELLRLEALVNADPVYHSAAVAKGVRIDDIVAELAEDGPAGRVREQAAQWMEQRNQHRDHRPCGKEQP